MFPYYLSIGMTDHQYWDGDPSLPRYYRKAEELRSKRKNEELWLQGLYIYEALYDVAPVLHAFAKRNAKPLPYPDHPYAISESDRKVEEQRKLEREKEEAKRYMLGKMANINKRFQSK